MSEITNFCAFRRKKYAILAAICHLSVFVTHFLAILVHDQDLQFLLVNGQNILGVFNLEDQHTMFLRGVKQGGDTGFD